MIRYSESQMEEIDKCFDRLLSKSSDVVGYLYYLLEEILADEEFCTLFPGQEICEVLGGIRQNAQTLNERIESLGQVQRELHQEIRHLEKRQLSRLEQFGSDAQMVRSSCESSARQREGPIARLGLEQEECVYLYKLLSGKAAKSNRSSLGAAGQILSDQYCCREVKTR